jgi:hypothetical protein
LTSHESEVAEQRAGQLRELQAASGDMLVELNERVGIAGRDVNAEELDAHLEGIRRALQDDPMLRVWWLTRLGVWVAWTLTCEFEGEWTLDRNPESRSFLRAVVANYPEGGQVRHEPMQIAAAATDAGESLASLMSQLGAEVRGG